MVSHLTDFASKLRSEKVKPLVETDRTLREVHDTITNMLKQLANEPSVGLYFVQQHVHNAVPAMVSMKIQMKTNSQEVGYVTEDVRDALNSVKSMKEVGPAVIGRMNKNLDSSLSHLASLRPSKRDDLAPDSLTRSGEIEDSLLLDTSEQQITLSTGPLLSSDQQINVEPRSGLISSVDTQSQVRPLASRGFQSLPAFFKEDVLGRSTAEGDYSGYVKTVFGTAFERASSVTVGNLVKWNTYSRDSTQGNASTGVDSEPQLQINSGKEAAMSPDFNSQNVLNAATRTASAPEKPVIELHEGNNSGKDKISLARDDRDIPGVSGASFGSGPSSLSFRQVALSFREVADYGNPARYLRTMFEPPKQGDGEVKGQLEEKKPFFNFGKSLGGRTWISGQNKATSGLNRQPEIDESLTEKVANDGSVIIDPDATDGEEILRFLDAEKASNATFAAEKAAKLEEWLQDSEKKEGEPE